MATEKIDIEVEVDVTPSIAELKRLQRELKNTTDPTEFKKLQQQIDDTKEAIGAARTGAGNFAEILGTLPGPIGDIAGRAGGLVGTFKQFGQIKLKDIQGSFVELGKDIVDAAKGIGNLTGITKVYTVINNALAKSFTAIGIAEGTAATGARAFAAALTATGVGAIVVAIGFAVDALITLTKELYANVSGQKELEAATKATNAAIERQATLFDLDAKDAERRRKVTIAQMKAQGKSEKEIRDFQIKESYKDYEAAYKAEQDLAKIVNDAQGKGDEESFKNAQKAFDAAQQKRKDAYASYLETGYNARAADNADQKASEQKATQTAQQNAQKREQIRKQEMDALVAGQKQAFLTTLSEREKEEFEVNEKYANLLFLATKYGEDTSTLRAAQEKELKTIGEKFRKEDYESALKDLELRNAQGLLTEEQYQKELYDTAIKYNQNTQDALIKYEAFKTEQRKKGLVEAREIQFLQLQDELDALDRANDAVVGDFQADILRLEQKKLLLQQQRDVELSNTELTNKERLDIIKKYADAEIEIGKEITANQRAEQEARLALQTQLLGAVASSFGALSQLFEQGTAASKIAALAEIAIGTGTGFINALDIAQKSAKATGPAAAFAFPIFYATQIAAVLAAAARAKSILSTAKSGGSSGGGSVSAPSAGPAPTFSAPRGIGAPQIQGATAAVSAESQIVATLGRMNEKPIVAQVVSTAVSSQAALDRRTNTAATFGGG